MKSLLKLHTLTLLGLALAANVGLQLLLAVGTVKSWGEIDWMDVVGEGCSGQLIPDTSIGGFDAIARS